MNFRTEPKQIKVLPNATDLIRVYGIVAGKPYDTILQQREWDDKSEVVYIENPTYKKGDRFNPPYLAVTKFEYTVTA